MQTSAKAGKCQKWENFWSATISGVSTNWHGLQVHTNKYRLLQKSNQPFLVCRPTHLKNFSKCTKHRTNKETNAKTQFIKNFSFIIKPVHSTSLSSSKYFFSIVCTSHQVRARHTGVIEEANNARHCECSWCINTDKPSICFCTRHQRHIQLTYSIRYKLPRNTPYCCYHLLQSGSSQNTVGGRPRSADWGAIISNRWKNWGAWTENEGAEAPRPGLEPPLHFFTISDGKLCPTDVQNIYNRLQ